MPEQRVEARVVGTSVTWAAPGEQCTSFWSGNQEHHLPSSKAHHLQDLPDAQGQFWLELVFESFPLKQTF